MVTSLFHYGHITVSLWSHHCLTVVTSLFHYGHITVSLWSQHCFTMVTSLSHCGHITVSLWSPHCLTVVTSLSHCVHITVSLCSPHCFTVVTSLSHCGHITVRDHTHTQTHICNTFIVCVCVCGGLCQLEHHVRYMYFGCSHRWLDKSCSVYDMYMYGPMGSVEGILHEYSLQ